MAGCSCGLQGLPDSVNEAALADGLAASVGDIITTRHNSRELRLRGGRDFVRNGYRWQVRQVHDDGQKRQ